MDIWLSQPVKYSDTYLIRDVMELMCQHVCGYISKNPDLNLPMDYESFFRLYTDISLQGFSLSEMAGEGGAEEGAEAREAKDHFDLAYEVDVLRLFQRTREISEHYDLHLKSSSSDLHEFLRETLDLAYGSDSYNM